MSSRTIATANRLIGELLGCGQTVRETIHNVKPIERRERPPVPFDADRFRWFFSNRDGRSLQSWRDEIDQQILNEWKATHGETA